MSRIKITLYPVDFESPFSLGDIVMSIAILAEGHSLRYELNPSGAVVEGPQADLLVFLERLKNETSGKYADKIAMIVSSPDVGRIDGISSGTNMQKDGSISRTPSLEEMVIEMIG